VSEPDDRELKEEIDEIMARVDRVMQTINEYCNQDLPEDRQDPSGTEA